MPENEVAGINSRNEAKRVLEIEAKALLELRDRLDHHFDQAVEILLSCRGKVIVTGIGKSGQVGRKIASTLSSTGTSSFFLHAAEGSHGDLGMISDNDVVIAISYGGESPELHDLLRFLVRKDIPLIAMTGNSSSSLGQAARVVLNVKVSEEACPLGLAPTASSTATLAMGDALAVAVFKMRGFSEADFAQLHPGGSLGRRLLTRVSDVMHSGEALPLVQTHTPIKQVLSVMTAKDVRGVAGVVSEQGDLVGVITDGDIRRRLEKVADPLSGTAADIMSHHPKTIDSQEMAQKALFLMEQFKIQLLFVISKGSPDPKKPVGLLHIQDLLTANVR